MKYSIGQWVRVDECIPTTFTEHKIEDIIEEGGDIFYVVDACMANEEKLTPWQPEVGEWCCIPSPDGGFIVGRYKIDICTARENKDIEPFLGELHSKFL